MQIRFLLFGLLVLLGHEISAQELQTKKIDTYAKAAFRYYANTYQSASQLKIKDSFTQTKDGNSYYHIFNFENGGFVILSGISGYDAVLGFSDEGKISLIESDRNDGLWGELSKHEDNIKRVIKGKIKAPTRVSKQWDKLKQLAESDKNLKTISFTPVVGPLTTTKWKQSGYFNDDIPIDENTGERGTNAGCVPIAIAQALRYYASPTPGVGSVSYEDPIHGLLGTDFCGQTFDYDDMPDTLSEYNATVAKFVYDVGLSMETQYNDRSTGTYRSKIPGALIYNFGFDQGLRWFTTTDSQRYSETLTTEFDAGRIVVLAAKNLDDDGRIDGGHCWVADGYGYSDDGVEYMHMNWGWGGLDNGWFLDTPGAWIPHEDNVDDYEIGYYYYRTTYYNIKPAEEFCVSPNPNYIEIGPRDTYAWMYNSRSDEELKKFRYRESGSSHWLETEATYESATFVSNLKKGTTYEYETARNCCGDWSSFSDSAEFTTTGDPKDDDAGDNANCPLENVSDMRTSAVKDDFAYIYTSQPNGRVNNQFRYRVLDSGDNWTETEVSDRHFRAIKNLQSATAYEFQVNHECNTADWSGFSASFIFTTTGIASDDDNETPTDDVNDDDLDVNTDTDCLKEDPSQMKASGIKDNAAIIYTRFPNGKVNNIFRYRVAGSSDWIETGSDDSHYRRLRDLLAGTTYEYQVNHQCSTNSDSGFSDSYEFTTTGIQDDTGGGDDTGGENENDEDETEMPLDSNCQKENTAEMKVSGIKDDFAYIYSRLPNGSVNNLMRYRVKGSSAWTITDESSKHYRALDNLSPNTTYEYQVNHECSNDGWSGWSDSFYFGTLNFTLSETRSREEPLPYEPRNVQIQISLFPNPASGTINVLLDTGRKKRLGANPKVEIIEHTGKIVKAIKVDGQDEIQLEISDLSEGMYILRYFDESGNRGLTRFVKIK